MAVDHRPQRLALNEGQTFSSIVQLASDAAPDASCIELNLPDHLANTTSRHYNRASAACTYQQLPQSTIQASLV